MPHSITIRRLPERLFGAFLALAFAIVAFPAITASSANANTVPFWEEADAAAKAGKHKRSGKYAKSSRKGYASSGYGKRKKSASLSGSWYGSSGESLTGGGGKIRWAANSGCLDSGLRAVLSAASAYGSITVNSTCRSHSHNRRVGGAKRSKHLTGDAVDFRVHGNAGAVLAYLRSSGAVGGLKHYGGGLFHIDNGDRRSW